MLCLDPAKLAPQTNLSSKETGTEHLLVTSPLKKEGGMGRCWFLLAVSTRPGQRPSQRLWGKDREGHKVLGKEG